MTPQQRYHQAVRKARILGARSMRKMLAGEAPFAECVMDLERAAIIAELGRAYDAGKRDGERQ